MKIKNVDVDVKIKAHNSLISEIPLMKDNS